jgi:hypothetical protein
MSRARRELIDGLNLPKANIFRIPLVAFLSEEKIFFNEMMKVKKVFDYRRSLFDFRISENSVPAKKS